MASWVLGFFVLPGKLLGGLGPLSILQFIGLGLFAIQPEHFVPFAPHGFAPMLGLILMTNFTCQGFEVAPVPAGEVKNAPRVVPRAMVSSLMISMVLYGVIQTIIVGSGADIANSEGPLADAARAFMGPWGGMLITIGAMLHERLCGGECISIAAFTGGLVRGRISPQGRYTVPPALQHPLRGDRPD